MYDIFHAFAGLSKDAYLAFFLGYVLLGIIGAFWLNRRGTEQQRAILEGAIVFGLWYFPAMLIFQIIAGILESLFCPYRVC